MCDGTLRAILAYTFPNQSFYEKLVLVISFTCLRQLFGRFCAGQGEPQLEDYQPKGPQQDARAGEVARIEVIQVHIYPTNQLSGKCDQFSLCMSPNPVCRVRQRLKSSKNSTFCARYLTFTTQLRSSCVYCISLGHCASNGSNHIENGPNRAEFWLKIVTFWLDRAPSRSGMSTIFF